MDLLTLDGVLPKRNKGADGKTKQKTRKTSFMVDFQRSSYSQKQEGIAPRMLPITIVDIEE